jgi:ABC-type transport system substrate-binding protein
MRRIALLALPLVVLALLACNALTQVSNPAAIYGVDRDEAIFLTGSQPQTLDPALTYAGPSGPLGHIFSGLVTLDPALQVQPDLATGWDVSDDGMTFTFFLDPEAVFHDGRPVTAADVVYSWERAAAPATGSDTAASYLNDIVDFAEYHAGQTDNLSGLRVLDDHTLEVTIDAPKPTFLAKLSYPVAFVVDRANIEMPDWERQPNGTGPFTLKTWEDDDILILERYDDYYRQPAALRHVVYLLGAGLPLSLYETDQIDLVGIDSSTLERALDPNDPLSADLVTGSAMCTDYVGYNAQLPPFDNVLVRQAFNHAIDRERLVTTLGQGRMLVANGPLPPGMPAFQDRPLTYEYDPGYAQELLLQAGYEPGSLPPLQYHVPGYGDVHAQATALITMWQENLGVTIEPVLIDPYTYTDELFAGNTGHIFDSGWCADYPDPENFLDVLFHSRAQQNLGGFADAEIDALLEAARVEQDTAARLALYAQIEEKLIATAPALFMSHPLSAILVKPVVSGYALAPIGVPQWHLVTIDR